MQFHWLYSELEDQQAAPPTYFGAKHIPLFSQRPFHFRIYLIVLWHPFSFVDTNTIIVRIITMKMLGRRKHECILQHSSRYGHMERTTFLNATKKGNFLLCILKFLQH